MDQDAIRKLDSAISKSPTVPDGLVVWRLGDSPLLHAHASRLAGCEMLDLGFLDVTCKATTAFSSSPSRSQVSCLSASPASRGPQGPREPHRARLVDPGRPTDMP